MADVQITFHLYVRYIIRLMEYAMLDRLNLFVRYVLDGHKAPEIDLLSTGEQCYIALAANRYDLLPDGYADPIEAWHRLDADLQHAVCEWRGWPKSYAGVQAETQPHVYGTHEEETE